MAASWLTDVASDGTRLVVLGGKGTDVGLGGGLLGSVGEPGDGGRFDVSRVCPHAPPRNWGGWSERGANVGLLLRRLDDSTASFPLRRIHVASAAWAVRGKSTLMEGKRSKQSRDAVEQENFSTSPPFEPPTCNRRHLREEVLLLSSKDALASALSPSRRWAAVLLCLELDLGVGSRQCGSPPD